MALRGRKALEESAPGIWIRRLGPPDTALLEYLATENGTFGVAGQRPALEPLSPYDAKLFLEDERTICLVAVVGKEPVGFVYACEMYRRHSVLRHLCVYEIGIDENYREKGIGKALIDELGVHAQKRGINQGFAIAHSEDWAATAMWRATGAIRGDQDTVFILHF